MKIKRIISALILAAVMTLLAASTGLTLDAATTADIDALKAKLKTLQARQEELEAQLEDINQQMRYIESSLIYSQSLVDGYTEYISTISEIVSRYETLIANTDKNIEETRADYEKTYRTYLSRLRSAREEKSYSFMELLASSENLVDFLTSAERAADGLDFDKRVMNKLVEQKNTLAVKLKEFEAYRDEQLSIIESYEAMKSSISERIDELNADIAEYRKQGGTVEGQLSEYERQMLVSNEELERLIKEYNSKTYAEYAIGETFLWPLEGYTNISSNFGYRYHPITGKWSGHTGIDIPAQYGTGIHASLSGVVVTSTYHSGYGYYVLIDHGVYKSSGTRLYTLYAHCSKLLVKQGDTVKRGDTIANVGQTGSATGPHLHFEVRLNSDAVDPLNGYIKVPK